MCPAIKQTFFLPLCKALLKLLFHFIQPALNKVFWFCLVSLQSWNYASYSLRIRILSLCLWFTSICMPGHYWNYLSLVCQNNHLLSLFNTVTNVKMIFWVNAVKTNFLISWLKKWQNFNKLKKARKIKENTKSSRYNPINPSQRNNNTNNKVLTLALLDFK